MRRVLVVALLVLAAAPAASAASPPQPGRILRNADIFLAARHAHPHARKERQKSCQLGAPKKRVPHATEAERRSSVVACEHPPRSIPLTSAALRHATAVAALLGG